MNGKDTPFDHNLVQELWYESAMPFLEGKFWVDTRRDYNKLILGEDVRITLLHYKDRLEAIYTPYYCPTALQYKWLEEISYPKVTRDKLEELRADNLTQRQIQDLLKTL